MTEPDNTPDATADADEKAAATESYGGVPVSDTELAEAWTTGDDSEDAGENAS